MLRLRRSFASLHSGSAQHDIALGTTELDHKSRWTRQNDVAHIIVSFASFGLVTFCCANPHLAVWAAFFRRFAAWPCADDGARAVVRPQFPAPLLHSVANSPLSQRQPRSQQ